MKLVDWFYEWWHQQVDRHKINEAFPLIAAIENQRRLGVEDLVKLTGYSESRVQKSLKFLYREDLIEGYSKLEPDDWENQRYLLTREGYRVFRREIVAQPSPSP